MFVQENPRLSPALALAIVLSLVVHALILFIPRQSPESQERPSGRIEAALAPRREPAKIVPPPLAKPARQASVNAPVRKNILAVDRAKSKTSVPPTPKWSVAEKEEMNQFLNELEVPSKPRPNLAQRSLAMAREYAREQAMQNEPGDEVVERLPNSPPVDAFSLEMYLDALVKKLNRSAGFVKNDPRSKGVKSALVQVRLKPDGSLLSFNVVNAADQQAEIAFIKSVVEQAVPFSAFPPDLRKSARSLTMMICIRPPSLNGGVGFTRSPQGRC